jgi:hypothetical protein
VMGLKVEDFSDEPALKDVFFIRVKQPGAMSCEAAATPCGATS